MRNRRMFSKLAWLLLFAALAAIAGGGCGGSSSNRNDVSNVTEINRTDHPLAFELRKLYDKMPEGTIFISDNITKDELTAAMPKIKAALEGGKIVGMYGPKRARIVELREMMGVDIFVNQTDAAAAAADGPQPEFYMIKRHDGIIFQHTLHYVDTDTPGVKPVEEGPIAITEAGDLPSSDVVPPASSDAEIKEMQKVRGKIERYGEMAASIVEWNSKVAEHAASLKAEREPARGSIGAAADIADLTKISTPTVRTHSHLFADKPGGYKFATVHITTTIYSCYSFEKHQNFYLINSSSSINCINSKANEYVYKHWSTGPGGEDHVQNSISSYSSKIVMQGISDLDDHSMLRIYGHMPHGSNKGEHSKEEIDHSIDGGPVSYFKDEDALFQYGEVEMTKEMSYYAHDHEIDDKTESSSPSPGVKYSFTPPTENYSTLFFMKLHDASDISRNFTSSESWIWMIARSAHAYKFQQTISLYNLYESSRQCILFVPHGETYKSSSGWDDYRFDVDLPRPPSIVAKSDLPSPLPGSDGQYRMQLLSDGIWSVTSDVDWVHFSETSGDKTGAMPRAITVTVDENPTLYSRSAKIIVRGTDDQSVSISIKQEKTQSTVRVSPENIYDIGKKGRQFKIDLLSKGDWRLECDADWVHLGEMSGGPTGSTPKKITVDVDENPSHFREAKIHVYDADGHMTYIPIEQTTIDVSVTPIDRTISVDVYDDVAIPFIYAQKNGGKLSLSLLSTGDWRITFEDYVASRSPWVHPSKTSGGPTGSTPTTITLTIDQNALSEERHAILYVWGVLAQDHIPIQIFQR